MCETCSPRDKRDRRLTPVTTLPTKKLTSETPLLAEATRTALDDVSRLDTAEGTLALYLAAQLDLGGHTGSQTAALAREFRATLEAVTRGAPGASTALDELRARRAKRRGA